MNLVDILLPFLLTGYGMPLVINQAEVGLGLRVNLLTLARSYPPPRHLCKVNLTIRFARRRIPP